MEFDSREEVLIWIISNQISRRNLTPLQLAHFRGIHYKADRKIQGDIYHNMLQKSQNGTFISGSTASRLAEEYNVSRNTILRNAKLAEGINAIGEMSPDVKRKILAGDLRIGKNRLEALASATTEEIGAVVAEMEEGTFQGRAQRNSRLTDAELASDSILPEIRQLNKVIRNFANDFTSMFRQLNDGGSMEMKTVLRSYIDQLEDLYRNL